MEEDILKQLEKKLRESEIRNVSGFLRLLAEACFMWGFEYGLKKGREQAAKDLALLMANEELTEV